MMDWDLGFRDWDLGFSRLRLSAEKLSCAKPQAANGRSRNPNPQLPNPRRARGAAMIEALLVLPVVLFILSLVVYFGFSMERMQREMMMDRYESWRGSARAPGPSTGIDANSSTLQLRQTFYAGDNPTVTVEPTDYFPIEPTEALGLAAERLNGRAGALWSQYFQEFPRGRSLRFFVSDNSGVPLWDRLFTGSIRHRHTVMDTDWRFFNFVVQGNEWFDDRTGTTELVLDPAADDRDPGVPTLGPGDAVREVFYSDFDRRLDPLTGNNALAERVQDFYTRYPTYRGPDVPATWFPRGGWQR